MYHLFIKYRSGALDSALTDSQFRSLLLVHRLHSEHWEYVFWRQNPEKILDLTIVWFHRKLNFLDSNWYSVWVANDWLVQYLYVYTLLLLAFLDLNPNHLGQLLINVKIIHSDPHLIFRIYTIDINRKIIHTGRYFKDCLFTLVLENNVMIIHCFQLVQTVQS